MKRRRDAWTFYRECVVCGNREPHCMIYTDGPRTAPEAREDWLAMEYPEDMRRCWKCDTLTMLKLHSVTASP